MSSSKRSKILVSRSFMSDAKSAGLVVLPGPPGKGGDQGTAGINDPGPSADLIPGTQNCRHCGDPIDGPPLTPSCPGSHSKPLEE